MADRLLLNDARLDWSSERGENIVYKNNTDVSAVPKLAKKQHI